MKLKEFRKVVKKEEYDIPNVYSNIKEEAYGANFEKKERRSLNYTFSRKALIGAFSVFIMAILLTIVLVSIDSVNNSRRNANEFYSINNQENLQRTLAKTRNVNSISLSDFLFKGGLANVAPSSSEKSEAPTNDIESSKTNTQVEGIDEADIIKTDGKYIYYATKYAFYIVEVNESSLVLTKKIVFNEDDKNVYANNYYLRTPCEVYVTDEYVIILNEIYKADSIFNDYGYTSSYYRYYGKSGEINIKILDKNDSFKEIKNFKTDGVIVDSRLTNDMLYCIVNIPLNYVDEKTNVILPSISIDNQIDSFEYRDIKYIEGANNSAYTILVSISLSDLNIYSKIQLGGSTWDTVYASNNALYLVSKLYEESKYTSTIYKYIYTDNGLEFDGSGKFVGYVENQWYLDEYNGYLRVAAIEGRFGDYTNKVMVFETKEENGVKSLEMIGLLDKGIGLNSGHTIRSVLFNENIVNICTYENRDPLYKIDLSDPTKPVILGELQAPGYSTYLFEVSEGYLLGIGYTDGWCYKLSLYDNTGDAPVQIGKDFTLNNTYDVEAAYNHRAIFTYDNLFGFSTKSYKDENVIIDENYIQIRYYDYSSYLLFEINPDEEVPISIKNSFEVKIENYRYDDNQHIRRMVYIDGTYYTVADNKIVCYNTNFEELSHLDLIEENN